MCALIGRLEAETDIVACHYEKQCVRLPPTRSPRSFAFSHSHSVIALSSRLAHSLLDYISSTASALVTRFLLIHSLNYCLEIVPRDNCDNGAH